MTTISKVPTKSEDSSLPTVKPAPSLKNLAAKVVEVRRIYKDLCQEQATLTPKHQKSFIEKVKALSVLEHEVAEEAKALGYSPENFGPLTQTATKVKQQLEVLRAPLKRSVAVPQVKAQAPKNPASAPKPTINAAAHDQRMTKAKNAIQALQEHLDTPGADEPNTIRLTREMDLAFQQVKAGNSTAQFRKGPEYQALLKQHDTLLTAALAPKIPTVINTAFTHDLLAISARIANLPTKCHSLEDYIAVQREEARIDATIANLKATHAKALRRHGIIVNPYTLAIESNRIDVPTDLSTQLEAVTVPFAKKQKKRAVNQDIFIAQNYTAHDMGGGGDCLFRTIAGCLGLDPNAAHAKARRFIAKHIGKNRDRYKELILDRFRTEDARIKAEIQAVPVNLENFKNVFGWINKEDVLVEQYIQWISNTGNWGGTPEIQAMSDFLQRPIAVVQTANGYARSNTFHPITTNGKDSLVIMNQAALIGGGVHFVSLLPK